MNELMKEKLTWKDALYLAAICAQIAVSAWRIGALEARFDKFEQGYVRKDVFELTITNLRLELVEHATAVNTATSQSHRVR